MSSTADPISNAPTEPFAPGAALESILNAYAIVFFNRHRGFGAIVLAATLLAPAYGFCGLAGVVTAFAGAWLLGFNRASIRNGELLYNSLMASFALAYLTGFHPITTGLFLVLLPAISLTALLLSVAFGHLTRQFLGLPSLSLPFVAVTILLYMLFFSFTGTPIVHVEAPYLTSDPFAFLPASAAYFLQSFSAVFFMPNTLVGTIVFAALLWRSRLVASFALIGFVAGMLFLQMTGLSASAFGAGWLGTNFVFCGIALGSIYFIPCRKSVLLAMLGPVLCMLIAVGMRTYLRNFNIPPLSLPFVAVVMLTVYSLRRRERVDDLFECPYAEALPEESQRRFHLVRKRFPDSHLPALFLPFTGDRVVTQGFDGAITHKGNWRHALDFEALDENEEPLPRQRSLLEDSYTFSSPVIAPCNGIVVRVVNHILDNPLGEQNLRDNWGNLVVLVNDFGAYVLLCHFKQNGVSVFEGQRVYRGQTLGFCGNSGRSPLPHLHLHVQSSPLIGAATMPFRLRHYIVFDPDRKPKFQILGLPQQGERLVAPIFDNEIAACFEASLGTRVRYRIELGGRTTGWETIETTSVSWGEMIYRSVERDAVVRASIADGIHVVHAMENAAGSILGQIGVSLGIVPFCRDRRVHWDDWFDPRPFRTLLGGWAADLWEPFFGNAFIQTRGSFGPSWRGACATIVTEIAPGAKAPSAAIPRRLEAQLDRSLGLVELKATTTAGEVRIVQEQWQRLSC